MGRKRIVDTEEFKRLWGKGLSHREIAKELGISIGRVKSLRTELKLPYRREVIKKVNDIEKVREMRLAGKTYQEIGNVFGVTRERIRQICKKIGLF